MITRARGFVNPRTPWNPGSYPRRRPSETPRRTEHPRFTHPQESSIIPRQIPLLKRSFFESAGRAALHSLERYLNTLGTIASAAPLLGLLGTVIGMIEIFGSQAPTGGGNPALLAHGISVALYNTAFGLMIAIPSLMFYRYFRRRVDTYALDMEQAAERMVPHLMRFAVPRQAA